MKGGAEAVRGRTCLIMKNVNINWSQSDQPLMNLVGGAAVVSVRIPFNQQVTELNSISPPVPGGRAASSNNSSVCTNPHCQFIRPGMTQELQPP